MLLVVERGREHEVEAVFEKWDLHAVKVGEVTEGIAPEDSRARRAGRRRAESRADRRSAGLPAGRCRCRSGRRASRSCRSPIWRRRRQRSRRSIALIAVPTIASKRWAYRQYDHTRRHQHHRAARHVGRGGARQGHDARPRHLRRRQRPLLLSRSVSGRDARGGRSVAQRRVRRRRADRRAPTTSTSAIPSGPRSCGRSAKRSAASATPAARSTCRSPAATSASTTKPKAARSSRRPVLGVVGLLDDASKTVTRAFKTVGVGGRAAGR